MSATDLKTAAAGRVPEQAVLLCAGEGRRLAPVTDIWPKPLVPVLNVPLLQHVLVALSAAGVRRVALNAFHLAEAVERFAADRPVPGLDLTVRRERKLLGTGGALVNLRDWVAPGPLLLLAGDILADFDLVALASAHAQGGAPATMALTARADPQRYGAVCVDDDGRIRDIAGLLGRPGGRAFVNASAHVLDEEFLAALPPGPCCLVRQGYVPLLAAGRPIATCVQSGAWHELGQAQALLAATAAALRDEIPIAPELLALGGVRDGAESLVHPSARVGDDVQLSGGTVLGAEAEVGDGARLHGCVVLPGARVPAGADLREVLLVPQRVAVA